MRKKTHLILFIFVLFAGTTHVNLKASEEKERKDKAEIRERIKNLQQVLSTNQPTDSAKEEELTTLLREITKYHLWDEKRLNDPRLRLLHPLKRLIIPYDPDC